MTAAAAPPPTEHPATPTTVPSPAAGTLVGLGFVALTALFFGAAPTFARLAFDGGTGTLTLQFARFAFAGIGLWLVLAAIGRPVRIPRRHLPLLAVLVVLSGGASYGYMTSVRYIPVPVASLVFFTFPLMVGPLAHLIGDERLTLRRVLALVVGFGGIVLVLEGGLGHADPWGLALAFGGGTCVAVSFQVSRRLTAEIPAMLLTATVATASAAVCGVLIALHGELDLPASARGWIGVAGNAVAYTVGLSCLFEAIRRLGAVRTAIAGNLEPVISVAVAAVVLDEALSGVQLAGAAVVLAGVALAQGRRRVQAGPPP
jgi:drug/metabolite transporter (DMT)-like permease